MEEKAKKITGNKNFRISASEQIADYRKLYNGSVSGGRKADRRTPCSELFTTVDPGSKLPFAETRIYKCSLL